MATRAADRSFLQQVKQHMADRFVEIMPSFSFGSTTYHALQQAGYGDVSEG